MEYADNPFRHQRWANLIFIRCRCLIPSGNPEDWEMVKPADLPVALVEPDIIAQAMQECVALPEQPDVWYFAFEAPADTYPAANDEGGTDGGPAAA